MNPTAPRPEPQGGPNSSVHGKVCLVTGASGGMGREIATELAHRGATVVLVARSHSTGDAVRQDINKVIGTDTRVEVLAADLSKQADIRRLAEQFTDRHDKLHVLVNNAGAHYRQRTLSADGIEMHLAVNHLGWFLLTNLLLEQLKAAAPSRVVNVASQAMADTRQVKLRRRPRPATLDLDDLQSERTYEPMAVYGRSKLAMVMCGYVLARRLQGSGVTVNAAHPGLTATSVVDAISYPAMRPLLGIVKRFLLTPEHGAQAALYLATAPDLETVTGKYFIKQTESRSPETSYNTEQQAKLWTASVELVGRQP